MSDACFGHVPGDHNRIFRYTVRVPVGVGVLGFDGRTQDLDRLQKKRAVALGLALEAFKKLGVTDGHGHVGSQRREKIQLLLIETRSVALLPQKKDRHELVMIIRRDAGDGVEHLHLFVDAGKKLLGEFAVAVMDDALAPDQAVDVLGDDGVAGEGQRPEFFLGKNADDGAFVIKTREPCGNFHAELPAGNVEDVRIFLRLVEDHPCVADVELAHDHAHDELEQELGLMDHDHALAGGLEFFLIIYFHIARNYAKTNAK